MTQAHSVFIQHQMWIRYFSKQDYSREQSYLASWSLHSGALLHNVWSTITRSWCECRISGLPQTYWIRVCKSRRSLGDLYVHQGGEAPLLQIGSQNNTIWTLNASINSPEGLVTTHITGPHSQSFWVHKSGVEPLSLPFKNVPRCCHWHNHLDIGESRGPSFGLQSCSCHLWTLRSHLSL